MGNAQACPSCTRILGVQQGDYSCRPFCEMRVGRQGLFVERAEDIWKVENRGRVRGQLEVEHRLELSACLHGRFERKTTQNY